MKPVVVVGGGLSGLAAGVALASAGRRVVVLEQRAYPGGRAFSFKDPRSGENLDNGQHLLIAAYRRTLSYLRTIGTEDRVAIQKRPEMSFHHPDRGFQSVSLPPLPPPLHLAAGVLGTGLFTFPEKRAILRAGFGLLGLPGRGHGKEEGMTVQEWLEKARQPLECRRSFWEPLAVSIMNERPERAPAAVFLGAMRTAFLGSRRGSAFVTPRVGLSDLFVHGAVVYIERLGGEVRCNCDVGEVTTRDGRAAGVSISDGSALEASAVILAVPSDRFLQLLPRPLRGNEKLMGIASVPGSPIICIHLWYDQDVMGTEVIGVIGKTVQWLFNVGRFTAAGRHRLTAVISAASGLVGTSNENLTACAAKDAATVCGAAAGKPVRSLVIRERRATISLTPEVEKLRPGPILPIRGLFLAGDWTATGLPATIEGAIVSGERAAALALME